MLKVAGTAVHHMAVTGETHGCHVQAVRAGVTVHPPSTMHVVLAEVMGGLMWSWLFIRMYEDGRGVLFGHMAHLDHELHEMHHAHDEEH